MKTLKNTTELEISIIFCTIVGMHEQQKVQMKPAQFMERYNHNQQSQLLSYLITILIHKSKKKGSSSVIVTS